MSRKGDLKLLEDEVQAWSLWRQTHSDAVPTPGNTNLRWMNLAGARLPGANFSGADLTGVDFSGADLSQAYLAGADLTRANFARANLSRANLAGTNLASAEFSGANLTDANLQNAVLVGTSFAGANLSGCRVYGMSAWDIRLANTIQTNLIITKPGDVEITVDNIELAQFLYLLINNTHIHKFVDTITSKLVLILGRFKPQRKIILDRLRDELRRRNYLPVLFDFGAPSNRDITETISLLAHMAHFIIADLTEPSSIPQELQRIIPDLAVPVQPLLQSGKATYAMFQDHIKYPWVLPVYRYEGINHLISTIVDAVISPAEAKLKSLGHGAKQYI